MTIYIGSCATCLALTLAAHGGLGDAVPNLEQVQQPPASFRVVRIVSGPRGSEAAGQFKLDEERTTFSRARDTQVIVSFQWEGAPGVHRLAARWTSPGGGLSSISEFEYTARERAFGAYWVLPISTSTPVGSWSIEATIDGLPSGMLKFDIVDSEAAPAATGRRPLGPSELYDRIGRVYAEIERSTVRGGRSSSAAGFLIAPGMIATAFAAIDAADSLELIAPGGTRRKVEAIAGWDRHQDWALLAAPDAGDTPLTPAPGLAAVGDRCYSMEGGAAGTRVLTEGTVVGRAESAAGGGRLIVAFSSGSGVPGAPVLNEFGEAIGLIGGALAPGPTRLQELLWARAPLHGMPVVPLSLVRPAASGESGSLPDLRRRGVLMAAVNGDENILSSGFARQIQRNPIRAVDQRDDFTLADKRIFVFIGWDPKERLRGTLTLRAFDDNNQPLAQSKPGKIDFKPGNTPFSQWELQVPPRPGVYRVDLLFGGTPIWRAFFIVKP